MKKLVAQVIVSVAAGLVLGVGTTIFAYQGRIARLEAIVEDQTEEIKRLRDTLASSQVATPYPTYTPLPACTPPLLAQTLTPTAIPPPTPTPGVLQSKVVAIRTFHGRYVTALNDQPGWNWELRAETTIVGDWEKFVLLYLSNGKVALRTYHGRFVSAMDNSGCCNWVLRAEKRERGTCEEFTLVDISGGRVAFETCYGKYVTAFDSSRCWMLRADAQSISDWEQFTLVPQE